MFNTGVRAVNLTTTSPSPHPPFYPLTHARTHAHRFSDELLDRYNVPHFMIFGTLLGAMRNGDIIPWTADLDLAVHFDHFQERVAGDPAALAWARSRGYHIFKDGALLYLLIS